MSQFCAAEKRQCLYVQKRLSWGRTTETAAMDSTQVTRRQARAIHGMVLSMRDYLFKLRRRMADRGFQPDDPLFALVKQAEQAIGELYVDVEFRMKCGPVDLPTRAQVNELEKRTMRKHEQRR
jgi:hypothetical protein